MRRKAVLNASPNKAHEILAELEKNFEIQIITQNIDNLHERAGSTRVLHLHGEIIKSRSSRFSELIYPIDGWELKMGDNCEKGYQLRPHIVWFGEDVPMIGKAADLVSNADIVAIIGTSMQVYPAAGLINSAPHGISIYIIDPGIPDNRSSRDVVFINEKATSGVAKLAKILIGFE